MVFIEPRRFLFIKFKERVRSVRCDLNFVKKGNIRIGIFGIGQIRSLRRIRGANFVYRMKFEVDFKEREREREKERRERER